MHAFGLSGLRDAPLAQRVAAGATARHEDVILSLPTIYCATCIHRCRTRCMRPSRRPCCPREPDAAPCHRRCAGLTADTGPIPVVERVGYEAHELDPPR